MQVVPIVSKDEIRRAFGFQSFEVFFDLFSLLGKKAGFVILDADPLWHSLQEQLSALQSLLLPLRPGTEDNPDELTSWVLMSKPQNCASATDLNIVGMRTKTQYLILCLSF